MRRIQDKLEQAKSTVKKAAQQECDARQQAKAASQAAAPETSQEAVISHELIRQHQGRDAAVLSIKKALQYTGPEALPIRWREALAKDFELDQQETLVKIKINPDGSSRRVLVIPESLVQRALYSCHGGYDCGHPGFLRSYQALYDKYHWSGMYADMKRHVQQCSICQMHVRAPSQSPIAGHITASRPGQAWVVDVLHMTPSEKGHEAVLVAVDVFSRYCVLMPMFTVESEEASELFKLYVVNGCGGVMDRVITDGGSEFKGEFDKLCQHYDMEHVVSAPGNAASHGMVERLIATTEITLAHFVDDDMTVWHKVLAHAQSVHNRTPHPSLATSVTKAYSPAEIFLGRKLLSKLDADLQTEVRAEEYDLEAYASQQGRSPQGYESSCAFLKSSTINVWTGQLVTCQDAGETSRWETSSSYTASQGRRKQQNCGESGKDLIRS